MSNILLEHFKAAGVCPSGLKKYLRIQHNMSNHDIQNIFDSGISKDLFIELMGSHIKAAKVIEAWESSNGRRK